MSMLHTLCNLDIFTTLVYSSPWEPEEYDGPFSTEPYATLAYSELEVDSEACQIYIMENSIQNHV